MEEQRCRLGGKIAVNLLHRTTEHIFSSWSHVAQLSLELHRRLTSNYLIQSRRLTSKYFIELLRRGRVQKKVMQAIVRILKRTSLSYLRVIMRNWSIFRFHQARLRKSARTLLAYGWKSCKCEHFGIWVATVVTFKAERVKTLQQSISAQKAAVFCERIMNRRVMLVVECWFQDFICSKGMKTLRRSALEKAAMRMRNAGLYKAWASWADTAKERRRQRSVMSRVGQRMKNAGFCCFVSWREHVAEGKRKRNITEAKNLKALAIWRTRATLGYFGAWHEHAAEETRKSNITERIVIRMMCRMLSGAMWRWCESLQERVRVES